MNAVLNLNDPWRMTGCAFAMKYSPHVMDCTMLLPKLCGGGFWWRNGWNFGAGARSSSRTSSIAFEARTRCCPRYLQGGLDDRSCLDRVDLLLSKEQACHQCVRSCLDPLLLPDLVGGLLSPKTGLSAYPLLEWCGPDPTV